MSEIATARSPIVEEYEAAQRGLTCFAQGTITHTFSTTRMERMHQFQEQFISLLSFEQDMQTVIEALKEPIKERGGRE